MYISCGYKLKTTLFFIISDMWLSVKSINTSEKIGGNEAIISYEHAPQKMESTFFTILDISLRKSEAIVHGAPTKNHGLVIKVQENIALLLCYM